MQHDDVIWSIIGPNFCSFRVKSQTLNFCKNTYNNTGLCNRTSCPLANSRYCTIIEKQGKLYLYIKSIERSHMPNKLWEQIELPNNNYTQALQLIDEYLAYWPQLLIHRTKQRVTKIYQYLIKIKQLKLSQRNKTVGIYKKKERQERSRENKAENAARITAAIESELLSRLQSGVYSESNMDYIPNKVYKKVLDVVADKNLQLQDNSDIDEDELEDDNAEIEYIDEYDEDGYNDINDIEDDSTFNFGDGSQNDNNIFDVSDNDDNVFNTTNSKTSSTTNTNNKSISSHKNKNKNKKSARHEIEYEYEQEATQSEIQSNHR